MLLRDRIFVLAAITVCACGSMAAQTRSTAPVISQHSTGSNSPNIHGNGNKVIIGGAEDNRFRAGVLFPGRGATPPLPGNCNGLDSGATYLFLGGNVLIVPRFPYPVIADEGRIVFTLDRASGGGLLVTFRQFDKNGNITVRFDRNHFLPNRNTLFDVKKSAHVLQLFDNTDTEILYVNFVNRHSIVIRGIFRFVNAGEPIIVKDSQLLDQHRNSFHGLCAEQDGGLFSFGNPPQRGFAVVSN